MRTKIVVFVLADYQNIEDTWRHNGIRRNLWCCSTDKKKDNKSRKLGHQKMISETD